MTADAQDPPGPATDASAWLEEHGDALYRFALARVGRREVAEDLVQETLLSAIRAGEGFRGESSPRTWLIAILRRKVADHYRRARAPDEPAGPILERFFDEAGHWLRGPRPWKSPHESLVDDEFWTVLDGCLGRLPPPLAEAFVRREREGQALDEVLDALGITAGNLRVRLHRARLLLRDCLEDRWFGNPRGRTT